MTDVVPKEKKIHAQTNFNRQILNHNETMFPLANISAKRTLRRILEEEDDFVGYRPNLGLPQKVSGAVQVQDVLHIAKLKQEFFTEVEDFKARQRAELAEKRDKNRAKTLQNSSIREKIKQKCQSYKAKLSAAESEFDEIA